MMTLKVKRYAMGTAAFAAALATIPAGAAPRAAHPDPAAGTQTQSPASDGDSSGGAAGEPGPVSGWNVETVSEPVVQPLPGDAPQVIAEPVMHWPVADAQALLRVIEGIGAEGLFPADYKPQILRDAIAQGASDDLDVAASQAFSWLAEDLRDGRTPMTARVQWFAVDPDSDDRPTEELMAEALTAHDIAGVLASLAPTHPDYAVLREKLAQTPPESRAARALIQANMDRWRWMKRDLGKAYLLSNVPEFQLRLTVNNKIIRSYRTVVGKPGRSATPQLAETVSAIVFNPTWTVPQSIVKGEGLGNKVLSNPAWARANGYTATKSANGFISVVQQPGPGNALGLMKIDIPNEHAIYFHDTPSKQYFDHEVRAYSHGCIRTERAVELGMTMAIIGAGLSPQEAAEISRSRQYTKVEMKRTFPAYITYFTMARDIDGEMRTFGDIYGRDKPVLDSFAEARQPKTTQRKSDEEIIQLDNPL